MLLTLRFRSSSIGCCFVTGTEKADNPEEAVALASMSGDDMLSRLSNIRRAASLVMAGEARTNVLCTDEADNALAEGAGDVMAEPTAALLGCVNA